MNYPKIRINCTSQRDLTINNKKITLVNYNKYSSQLNDDVENLIKVSLLFEDNFHHRDKNFINKTLEFYFKNDLNSREEFELFIQRLHNLGYKSKKEVAKIQYFNSSGNIEYNYDFNSIKPFNKNSINNIYHRQNLFMRN